MNDTTLLDPTASILETNSLKPRSRRASLAKRIGISLMRILSGVPIVSLLGVGLLLLIFSTTLRGRSIGLSAVLLGGLLYGSVGYWNRSGFKRIRGRLYAALLPLCLVLYLVPMILSPSGGTADGRVRNCFLGGQEKFSRFAPLECHSRGRSAQNRHVTPAAG